MKDRKFHLSVRLAAGILVLLAIAVLLEGGSRLVLAFEDEIRRSPILSIPLRAGLLLDPYEMSPPGMGYHWVLRPGYSASREKMIAAKTASKSIIGLKLLNKKGAVGIRINSDGFRGPEIDKTHAKPRVLILGDSVTFGLGSVSYPRIIERRLNDSGVAAEIVNGGVEGYGPRNLLFEIKRYKSLKPEITVIFIGWNSLFTELDPTNNWGRYSKFIILANKAVNLIRSIIYGKQAFAVKLYNRELSAERNAPEIGVLDYYEPSFMSYFDRIIDGLEAAGSRVVIATLPGLFTMTGEPSEKALKIGHLPRFTTNPFVLAKMAGRLNQRLRDLARRRGLALIDLEKWSETALVPRDAYFTDSVHLSAAGLDKVGTYMAEQLKKLKELKK